MPDTPDITMYTQRCALRPWCKEDAPLLPAIANTKDISWNTSYRFAHPFDLEAAEKYVETKSNNDDSNWNFAVLMDDEIIGGCGAWRGQDIHAHTAEIGYWLGTEYWGKGLATEIVAALVDYLAAATDLEQLSANCFGWNPASPRVLEKCGFVKEGVRKGAVKKWGKRTDMLVYGKLLR